jgi:hypothetical protein
MNKLFIIFIICTFISPPSSARNIRLAVGLDHSRMISDNYPLYRASWIFLTQALRESGHTVSVVSQSSINALVTVQEGKLDGLFLAANLIGREKWAVLSSPLGYDYFGFFINKLNKNAQGAIGTVNIGNLDQILSNQQQNELLQIATAQRGLKQLAKQKIGKFILAEGYGKYLLNNELKSISENIKFQTSGAERRSAHVALSKQNPNYKILQKIINDAIRSGIEKGDYDKIMNESHLPLKMRVSNP